MLKNIIVTALRSLTRNKVYSLINIVGLAVGMASCALITLWIVDECSYDRFHSNADRIYRILGVKEEGTTLDGFDYDSYVAAAYVSTFKQNIPEVEYATRYARTYQELLLRYGDVSHYVKDLGYGDPEFFKIFQFPFIRGNPEKALQEPYSIVLTDSLSRLYFGDENPMGQTFDLLDTGFTVTGIIQDIPSNCHERFSCFIRIQDIGVDLENWNRIYYRSYVLLHEGSDATEVSEKMRSVVDKLGGRDARQVAIQPLKDIHLFSDGIRDYQRGDIRHVRIFGAIAILIILIACINFVNLSTARAIRRAREVGVRKVVGAGRFALVRQFMGETLVTALLASLLAYVFVELALPIFNSATGKKINLGAFTTWELLLPAIGLILLVSLLAGAYPSFVLSSFRPVQVLKAALPGNGRGVTLRKVLVLSQFALTVILMLSAIVIYRQYDYMRNSDLGCNLRDVVYVKKDGVMWDKHDVLKQELLAIPGVSRVAAVSRMVPLGVYRYNFMDWEGCEDKSDHVWTTLSMADDDFLDLFDIELVAGRNFSPASVDKPKPEVIVNEAFVRGAGLESPLGKWIKCHFWDYEEHTIIGVVKDFHYNSFHSEIPPLTITCEPYDCRYLAVKIGSDDVSSTLGAVASVITGIESNVPFDYAFLYDRYGVLYRKEKNLGMLIGTFSGLAVLVACLGLIGLVTFMSQRRTKEIGVRKVLGASITSVIGLLSREFMILVVLANVIAWPIGYYIMSRWLENFAYKTDLGWYIFVFTGGLALFIAMGAVSFQAARAAYTNPVEALRDE